MEQLKTSEFKLQNSETTVTSIAEFFNNNALVKLDKLKEKKLKAKTKAKKEKRGRK
jgi:hypothetical protein